jgi:hypothetical protein
MKTPDDARQKVSHSSSLPALAGAAEAAGLAAVSAGTLTAVGLAATGAERARACGFGRLSGTARCAVAMAV